jgi:two-component system NtrC family response regulator
MAERQQISHTDLSLTTDENTETPPPITTLQNAREAAEIKAIRQAMIEAGGNVSQAAKLLHITRPTLYSLLDKYALKQDSW